MRAEASQVLFFPVLVSGPGMASLFMAMAWRAAAERFGSRCSIRRHLRDALTWRAGPISRSCMAWAYAREGAENLADT